MMHLVDHEVGRRLYHRMLVAAPMFWVGLLHIDNGTTLAIHAYGLGKHTCTLAFTNVESIELTHQIAFYGGSPEFFSCSRHLNGLQSLTVFSLLIDADGNFLRIIGGEEGKHGFARSIVHLLKYLSCRLMRPQHGQ